MTKEEENYVMDRQIRNELYDRTFNGKYESEEMNPIKLHPTRIGEQQEAMSLASWMVFQLESALLDSYGMDELEASQLGKKSDWEG